MKLDFVTKTHDSLDGYLEKNLLSFVEIDSVSIPCHDCFGINDVLLELKTRKSNLCLVDLDRVLKSLEEKSLTR